jgi:hypothetical protein
MLCCVVQRGKSEAVVEIGAVVCMYLDGHASALGHRGEDEDGDGDGDEAGDVEGHLCGWELWRERSGRKRSLCGSSPSYLNILTAYDIMIFGERLYLHFILQVMFYILYIIFVFDI